MDKEQRAKEYAIARYGSNDERNETQYEMAKVVACRVGFEKGWDEALKSQWIKVEEKTPNEHEEVLVLFEQEGEIRIGTDVYFGDDFYNYYRNYVWDYGGEKIIAWMPIPAFDQILKANKDVLMRLKDE